jgi:hypothetical protein
MKKMHTMDLTIADMHRYPVWEYAQDDDETRIVPVRSWPVHTLTNRLVATQVRLLSGRQIWAMLSNIDLKSQISTQHFITLTLKLGRAWFSLARYHDFDYEQRSPAALSKVLRMDINEIFPSAFDVRKLVYRGKASAHGLIPKEPVKRLSEDELLDLAVESGGCPPN